MEDLTDMQNHVLPICRTSAVWKKKGVQERREQQIADKNESRTTTVTGVEQQAK